MAIKYIFFDCFNTLIDDFDEFGDETGMRPLSHIPVKYGIYQEPEHFYLDYLNWRKNYWSNGNHNEVLLADRLRHIFQNALKGRSAEGTIRLAIEEMILSFYEVFPSTIRKSKAVHDVLDHFRAKIPMAVVSNFFLPGYPEEMLKINGLDHYFDFVIDSAQLMIKKPGIEIYHIALRKAGIPENNLHETLFIGDNLINDVLAPIKMGMQAWHFDRSAERPAVPIPAGIKSFHSWDQLTDMITEVIS